MTAVQFRKVWDLLEGKLVRRRWDYLRDSWLRSLPSINPAGCPPTGTISDIVSELVSGPRSDAGVLKTFGFPIGEALELLFREGVYWLHKALHVLGAAEIHAAGGMPTWSLSSAYQSAFFSARASMAFLGLALAERAKTTYVVEFCRDMGTMSPREYGATGAFEAEAQFHTIGTLFDHRQIWTLFQRVLRLTTREPWPTGLRGYVSQLDVAEITRQRHDLHYELQGWVFPDLHNFTLVSDFENFHPTGQGRGLFDSAQPSFTFTLASAVLRLALDPFLDISRNTNRILTEAGLLQSCLLEERHPILFESLEGISTSPVAVPL